ncbi:MAG: HDOD domain-containing protein [Proteobacteria bacterium]|nr:HDOD domain-containing protein [Pseudomonadota bacterium]MBU1716989.1 HDOD domain-containing protein [Pseudomonadota bacterium]
MFQEQLANKDNGNIFIARQPIFRKNKRVFGYELLFRSSLDNFFDPAEDGVKASSNVIVDSFLLIGINNITQGKKAFINFTQEMLRLEYPILFPRRQTVIEILEDVEITDELISACRYLSNEGYVLALDDFQYEPRFDPLLPLVDIIKFDIQLMSLGELERQVEIVSQYNVKLLAEKIQNDDEFETTKDMGFDYFQGYFFRRPNIIVGKDIPGSKMQYLQILKEIKDDNYSFVKLAKLIADDVSLSYKLLKYVNSAFFRRRQEIHSLQSAVAMVGEDSLRKWLSFMMISYLAEDKPDELVRLAILRANFCEQLGEMMPGPGKADKFHTVGMFSMLEALLDKPMPVILQGLNLSDDINNALLGRKKGRLYGALYLAQAYERGAWEAVAKLSRKLGVDQETLPVIYEKSLEVVRMYDFL